jgi:ANTAR domain
MQRLLLERGAAGFLTAFVAGAVPQARPGLSCSLLVPRQSRPSSAGRAPAPVSLASTGDPAGALDQLQAHLGEGPSLTTVALGTCTEVTTLTGDDRWPRYQQEAQTWGAPASLSVPVPVIGPDSTSTAALTLYYLDPAEPAAGDQHYLDDYAARASGMLSLALLICAQQELVDDLQAALASRAIIDMAKGVLMARNSCSSDAAFNLLRQMSSRTNQKLRDVATQIVTSVSGTAPSAAPTFHTPR